MVLRDKDQNRFILDRMDEYFKVRVDETQSNRNRKKPQTYSIIQSARNVISELKATCQECAEEMNCRNPKIVAHCRWEPINRVHSTLEQIILDIAKCFVNRNYIRKYAEMVKGRVTLELLCIPGAQEKQFEEMGEKAICAAVELMNEIDELKEFSFLPETMIASLNSTLFSAGQLLSALLNISLQRVDAFFASIALLFVNQRPAKLLDIVKVVSETLQAVEVDKQYPQLLRTLLVKVRPISILAIPFVPCVILSFLRNC